MHEAKTANLDDLIFTYFVATGRVKRCSGVFVSVSFGHSRTKTALDSLCHCLIIIITVGLKFCQVYIFRPNTLVEQQHH